MAKSVGEYQLEALDLLTDHLPIIQKAHEYLENKEQECLMSTFLTMRSMIFDFAALMRPDVDSTSAKSLYDKLVQQMSESIQQPYILAFDLKLNSMDYNYNLGKSGKSIFWDLVLFLRKEHNEKSRELKPILAKAKSLRLIGGQKANSNTLLSPRFNEGIEHLKKARKKLDEAETIFRSMVRTRRSRRFTLIFVAIGLGTIASLMAGCLQGIARKLFQIITQPK